jgi:hypothetical protein
VAKCQLAKVFVESDEHPTFSLSASQHILIGDARSNKPDPYHVVSARYQGGNGNTWEVFIG